MPLLCVLLTGQLGEVPRVEDVENSRLEIGIIAFVDMVVEKSAMLSVVIV